MVGVVIGNLGINIRFHSSFRYFSTTKKKMEFWRIFFIKISSNLRDRKEINGIVKWMRTRLLVQFIAAIQIKIFSESSMAFFKSKMTKNCHFKEGNKKHTVRPEKTA